MENFDRGFTLKNELANRIIYFPFQKNCHFLSTDKQLVFCWIWAYCVRIRTSLNYQEVVFIGWPSFQYPFVGCLPELKDFVFFVFQGRGVVLEMVLPTLHLLSLLLQLSVSQMACNCSSTPPWRMRNAYQSIICGNVVSCERNINIIPRLGEQDLR